MMESSAKYVDAHCHLHEFPDDYIEKVVEKVVILAVSDDIESSRRTIALGNKYSNVHACIGVHPWDVGKEEVRIELFKKLIEENREVTCIGEVGLDKIFVPHTYEVQLKIFEEFLKLAKEYDLALNLHTAGAWREVFDLVVKYDINRAIFHWYTGPLNLLDMLVEAGYKISINPSLVFQKKHKRVLETCPLKAILTESDGPYKYRGLELKPDLIPELVKTIALVKNVSTEQLLEIITRNLGAIIK